MKVIEIIREFLSVVNPRDAAIKMIVIFLSLLLAVSLLLIILKLLEKWIKSIIEKRR